MSNFWPMELLNNISELVKVLRWGVLRVLEGQTGARGRADTGAVGGD